MWIFSGCLLFGSYTSKDWTDSGPRFQFRPYNHFRESWSRAKFHHENTRARGMVYLVEVHQVEMWWSKAVGRRSRPAVSAMLDKDRSVHEQRRDATARWGRGK